MIGTLTRFELRKKLGGKFFRIALALLLIVNVLLNCGLQEHLDWMAHIEDGTAIGITQENQTYLGGIREKHKLVSTRREISDVFACLTQEELDAYASAMQARYGENIFDAVIPTEEMEKTPGYLGQYSDLIYLIQYSTNQLTNHEIQSAMESVVASAKRLGREALAQGDDYDVRRNLQIIRLYSQPRGRVNYSPMFGWDDYLFENTSMLLVCLLVLLCCAGSFTSEGEGQTWLLLQTAKNGKGKTLLAKYLAGAIAAAGLTVLFRSVTLLTTWYKSGFLGGSQTLAAFQEMMLCPYLFSIRQYSLVSLGCQIFGAVVLSMLVNTISSMSKSNVIAYGISGILLAGCLWLSFAPPRLEWLSGPLALIQPDRFFSAYYTADILGFPVMWVVVLGVVWSIACALCIPLAHWVYHRKRRTI